MYDESRLNDEEVKGATTQESIPLKKMQAYIQKKENSGYLWESGVVATCNRCSCD